MIILENTKAHMKFAFRTIATKMILSDMCCIIKDNRVQNYSQIYNTS